MAHACSQRRRLPHCFRTFRHSAPQPCPAKNGLESHVLELLERCGACISNFPERRGAAYA
eukprot:9064074-Alexandrium_andersonii.AAC.1